LTNFNPFNEATKRITAYSEMSFNKNKPQLLHLTHKNSMSVESSKTFLQKNPAHSSSTFIQNHPGTPAIPFQATPQLLETSKHCPVASVVVMSGIPPRLSHRPSLGLGISKNWLVSLPSPNVPTPNIRPHYKGLLTIGFP